MKISREKCSDDIYFMGCNNIKKVYVKMAVPKDGILFEHDAYTNATLYVPQKSPNAYKDSKT